MLLNADDSEGHDDNLELNLDHYEDVRLPLTTQKIFIALLSLCVRGGSLLILGKGHCHGNAASSHLEEGHNDIRTLKEKYTNTKYRNYMNNW